MAEMSELELIALLNDIEGGAVSYNGSFNAENESLFKQYKAEPYGDEVEGRSSVVSTDVADVVESDMPSKVRVFLGSGTIATFEPNNSNEQEEKEAEDKSKYVDWLIRQQPWSFQVIHGWMKDSSIQKMGVVKYYVEDSRTTEEHKYSNVAPLEIEQIQASLRGEDVSKVELTAHLENDQGNFDLEFRVTTGKQEFKVVGVPTENFLISRNATSEDDAEMIGDKTLVKRGELLSQGIDRSIIDKLPVYETTTGNSNMKSLRFKSQGGNTEDTVKNWASEEVEVTSMCVRVDYDGDGIAERRRVLKAGNVILENESFNHVNYAILSDVLMPHSAIGRSRAELTTSNQRVKTVVLRQTLDNLYLVNNGRNIVSDDVNLDDMLTVRPNGIVRTDGEVDRAVFPLVTPYVGDKSLQVIQYLDFARAQSTGALMASQGLTGDDLNKETATRFNGVQDEAKAKIELVNRAHAETGFRKLYEGMAWLVAQYQDSETEFRVLGRPLKIDPRSWKHNHSVKLNVGLGAGDSDKMLQSMMTLYQIQQGLKQQGSALVDEVDIFNTLDRIVKGVGLARTDEFFNDPEVPDEMLKAENEILKNVVQQLQQQVQQSPLAEAETIRAEAKLIEANQKQGLEATKAASNRELQEAKIESDNMQFALKLQQDQKKQMQDMALKITELELANQTDLPGGLDEQ